MKSETNIILGIDPGSRCTGYGVIWVKGQKQGCIAYGQIKTQHEDLADRLLEIHRGISDVIAQHNPHTAAIEKVFVQRNVSSALKLGQARGAALVSLASAGLAVGEYSPREIKKAVVGYGAATKEQIQHMTTRILGLSETPPTDAADALAIAICHSNTHCALQTQAMAIA